MQTSIRSTTDSTLSMATCPRTENDGGNSWKRLRSSLGLARDDDDEWIRPI